MGHPVAAAGSTPPSMCPTGFRKAWPPSTPARTATRAVPAPSHEAPFKVTLLAVVPTTLLVDPNSGQPGDTRTVSGAGWTTGNTRSTSLPANPKAAMSTTPSRRSRLTSRESSALPLTVPDRDPRDYTFYACQRCSDPENRSTAVSAFTIERDGLRWWDVAGGILLLVAAAAAGAGVATAWHHRRVKLTRGHRLEPHDDPDIEVELLPLHGRPLPTVRLVPRNDEPSNQDRVEVTQVATTEERRLSTGPRSPTRRYWSATTRSPNRLEANGSWTPPTMR